MNDNENLFGRYKEEFLEFINDLDVKIARIPQLKPHQKEGEIRDLEGILEDAEDALAGMGLTAQNCKNSQEKKELVGKYKEKVMDYKRKLRKAAISLNDNAREELFGGDTVDDMTATSEDHRSRVGDTTQLLLSGDSHINTALSTIHQTEETGEGILVELHRQRSVLEKVRDMLRGINQKLTRAGKLMNAISKHLCASKLMLWASVVIILLAIILVVWLRFFPPGKKVASTTAPTDAPTVLPTFAPTTVPTTVPSTVPSVSPTPTQSTFPPTTSPTTTGR
eukprot:TRINITY_DN4990_c0_g1_i1.p1 TRINITY_DN4990_c0_g1~~TRINITY_DN4990_c0_g1_i1.p1  ORF type:complete len:280 (+),score=103.70 TRINITY_DN4990_c0_g1_i1:239-1078(+)